MPPATPPQCDFCALRTRAVEVHWIANRRVVLCVDSNGCNARASRLRPRQSSGQRPLTVVPAAAESEQVESPQP